jgi:hypothetical protein
VKVLSDLKVATFRSWEAASCSATLTAISTATGVLLVLGNEHKECNAVELTHAEAHDLSADLQKFLSPQGQLLRREARAGAETVRAIEGSDLIVATNINTAGDPYREAVSFEVRNSAYKEFLYFDFEAYTCHEFAAFLHLSAQPIEAPAVKTLT